MQRLLRQAVALAAVGLVFALAAGTSQAATPAPRLLAMYQPVLHFDPLEKFRPASVQSFIADADLEQLTAPNTWSVVDSTPEPGDLPAAGSGIWRLNQDSCSPGSALGGLDCYAAVWNEGSGGPVVYGHVAQDGDHTVLQYWLFYYDDVYSYTYPPSDFIWQAHEGDWEVVNVVLDEDEQPVSAAYSQHCLGQTRDWANTPKVGDTHPVVYVALGSHANYFEQTSSPTQFVRCVYKNVAKAERSKARRLVSAAQNGITDRTGTAHKLDPDAPQQPSPQLVDLDSGLPLWGRFSGRWSEGELLWIGRTPTRFTRVRSGLGPATPRWTATSIPALWHTDSS